jgi:uncharacterized phosphosugar-binding protein
VTRSECLKLGAAFVLTALWEALLLEGTEGAQSAGQRYLDEVLALLNRLKRQWKAIRSAGEAVAECLLGGHKLYVWDAEGAIKSEALGRAGGFMAVRAFSAESDKLSAGDVLLLASRSPDGEQALNIIRKAGEAGCNVIVLAPPGGLTKAGLRCVELPIPKGDAAVAVRGAARVGPTSGVACCAALWAVLAEAALKMAEKGRPPHIWRSIKLPDASVYNSNALKETEEQGF